MQVKDIVMPAVTISETETFASALTAMLAGETNTLLVTNKKGKLVGELTVANLLEETIPDTLSGNDVVEHFKTDEAFTASIEIAKDIPVSEFMSHDYSALTLKDDLTSIIATAIAFDRASIPVVDEDDRPIGIIARQGLKKILNTFI